MTKKLGPLKTLFSGLLLSSLRNSDRKRQGTESMVDIEISEAELENFLPDLKKPTVFLGVVLIGELFALTLSVTASGLLPLNWDEFGLLSVLIQWISLTSVAVIIPLQPFLNRLSPALAGSLCFVLIISLTATYSILGNTLLEFGAVVNVPVVARNLLIAAIFSGIGLRYMYVQQQLRNQYKAHLKAQLQALQSRIQPHFLFNSMNSIASLIMIDPDKAEKMVEDLSDLFRANLAEPGLVSVAEELQLCERYLAIEALRLGDRLKLEWQVSDSARSQLIPRLLVQPLLENAIKYGIQPRLEGGKIEIILHNDELNLYLRVSNPVEADKIVATGNQLALKNVLARLRAHFGHRSSCQVESSTNAFTVNIQYPLKN